MDVLLELPVTLRLPIRKNSLFDKICTTDPPCSPPVGAKWRTVKSGVHEPCPSLGRHPALAPWTEPDKTTPWPPVVLRASLARPPAPTSPGCSRVWQRPSNR